MPVFRFESPLVGQLSRAGGVDFRLRLHPLAISGTLEVTVTGPSGLPVDVGPIDIAGRTATGTLVGLAPGRYVAEAEVDVRVPRFANGRLTTSAWFETVELTGGDGCEVLNQGHCMLPYPSTHFLESAPTPTGFRLNFADGGLPVQLGQPLSPEPYRVLDGFSPTVQIQMHFPDGVSPELSNASRLLAETRSYGTRSLEDDSPSVLIDAQTGERTLHFIEPDIRAGFPNPNFERQVLFLRPGRSLTPGRRYIVAMRNLRHPDGTPVVAEPVFAALRDGRPSDIPEVEARRAGMEDVFRKLRGASGPRRDLVLAFDFVVQSDYGLTH